MFGHDNDNATPMLLNVFFSGRSDPDQGQLHPDPPPSTLIYTGNVAIILFLFTYMGFFRSRLDPDPGCFSRIG